MLTHWLSQPNGRVHTMVEDTRVIALHVLTAAGFGKSNDFHGGSREVTPGHQLSHRDALMTVLENFILSILLTQMPLLKKLGSRLPLNWQKLILAMKEFRQYMDEMLDSEREAIAKSDDSTKPNLISQLIRTSDGARKESGSTSSLRLSDEEIRGNIFIFSLAGHDTTANALAYAFGLLAIHPEIQDWVLEEVDLVLGESKDVLQYEEVFPRLKRVMAVMVCFSLLFSSLLLPLFIQTFSVVLNCFNHILDPVFSSLSFQNILLPTPILQSTVYFSLIFH